MIHINRYERDMADEWNLFCRSSKMPLFMFDRNYMDYHSDRFIDHSLMFYYNDELTAVLPASQSGNTLVSHGGLTYGGLITSAKMKQHIMNECFEEMIGYCRSVGFESVYYKTIPHIFHVIPAEEDLYSLFINNAKIVKAEAATVVDLKSPQKMSDLRKRRISKAKREGVAVEVRNTFDDFSEFVSLVNFVLAKYHNAKAVHTAEELYLLYSRFPDNIHLYAAIYHGEMIAGSLIFEYRDVIHTQYLAANDTARKIGGLDSVIQAIIDDYSEKKKWLDFGISTEEHGRVLNEGLISQKEGFGGRTNIYNTWELRIQRC